MKTNSFENSFQKLCLLNLNIQTSGSLPIPLEINIYTKTLTPTRINQKN